MKEIRLPERFLPALCVMIAIIMAVMDGTIVNVALPTLSREFGVKPEQSIWIANAYQLVIVMFLFIFSAIGDRVSYKKVFLWGIGGFTLGSVLCAVSPDFRILILSRVIQGLGAAAVMSVNTALVRFIYPPHLLGRGMSLNAMAVAVSAAAGPTIAGFLLSVLSWHWLFAINLPLGLLTLWLGRRWLPDQRSEQAVRFDWVGSLGNMATFFLMIMAFESFAQKENIVYQVSVCVAFLIVGTLFMVHQFRRPIPLFPVDLLKIPLFSLSVATSICSYMAQMLGMVSLPFLLHDNLGYSPIEVGLLLTPWPLTTMFVAPVAARLIERHHPGTVGAIGLLIFSIGFLSLYFLPEKATALDILWRVMLCGAGFGLFQTPNNVTLVASAPVHRSGGASGMLGMARLLGQTIGTAGVALVFSLQSHTQGSHTALLMAAIIAFVAILASFSRRSQEFNPVARK